MDNPEAKAKVRQAIADILAKLDRRIDEFMDEDVTKAIDAWYATSPEYWQGLVETKTNS